MVVHVLYLTVVITVPVCMDLQVHDVKVRSHCHSIFNNPIINHVHSYEYLPNNVIFFFNCLPSSLFIKKYVCIRTKNTKHSEWKINSNRQYNTRGTYDQLIIASGWAFGFLLTFIYYLWYVPGIVLSVTNVTICNFFS